MSTFRNLTTLVMALVLCVFVSVAAAQQSTPRPAVEPACQNIRGHKYPNIRGHHTYFLLLTRCGTVG